MNNNAIEIIESTKKWIYEFVIQKNLCPFARYGFEKNKIEYRYFDDLAESTILEAFYELIQTLQSDPSISNAFLILNANISFEQLLSVSSICQFFMEELTIEDNFQLVDFHPNLTFDESQKNEASNFINRSPYPMIHILRTEEVEQAINNYVGDVDEIPNDNIKKMLEIGYEILSKNLKKYRE